MGPRDPQGQPWPRMSASGGVNSGGKAAYHGNGNHHGIPVLTHQGKHPLCVPISCPVLSLTFRNFPQEVNFGILELEGSRGMSLSNPLRV